MTFPPAHRLLPADPHQAATVRTLPVEYTDAAGDVVARSVGFAVNNRWQLGWTPLRGWYCFAHPTTWSVAR